MLTLFILGTFLKDTKDHLDYLLSAVLGDVAFVFLLILFYRGGF